MPSVVYVREQGGPHLLSVEEVDAPAPDEGEIRFTVDAYALNRADILYMEGNHYTELKRPSRVGLEACGVVDAIGAGVSRVKIGDRVSSIPFHSPTPERHGVHGEFAIIPEDYAAPWPQQLNPLEACSVWMQFPTAYFALKNAGNLKSGETALVVAGASSAGVGAIQMAKSFGAQVIATTRSKNKAGFIKRNGADHVIVTDDDAPFADEILVCSSGAGVNVACDPVCGDYSTRYVDALASGAKILIYGALSNDQTIKVPLLPILRAKGSIHPFSLYNFIGDRALREEAIAFISTKIEAGEFTSPIDKVFPFDKAITAYEYMLANEQKGKIVVAVSDNARNCRKVE